MGLKWAREVLMETELVLLEELEVEKVVEVVEVKVVLEVEEVEAEVELSGDWSHQLPVTPPPPCRL